MLTTVYLDGAMGKLFGRKWKFAINSPREALDMIEANKPGLKNWIRAHLGEYSRYRVTCEYEDGRKDDLESESFDFERKMKSIRFVPIVEGAGNVGRIVLGIVLMVVGYFTLWTGYGATLLTIGAGMIFGGVIGLLSPQPTKDNTAGISSKYFDGPANTSSQGNPVQLIYGTQVLVGSQVISARLSVDQLINPPGPSAVDPETTPYVYDSTASRDSWWTGGD